MSERDTRRYERIRSDPVVYAAFLERQRKHRKKVQELRAGETMRKRKWREANRAKDQAMHFAHRAVEEALADGRLAKPKVCNRCAEEKPLQGHHHSYAPEHRLDVEWLCQTCHSKEHRKHK